MTLKRMQCPAYPMCVTAVVVHFPAGPGRNSWGTYAAHPIPSGSMAGLPCPASHVRITWAGVIKGADRARIAELGGKWLERVRSGHSWPGDPGINEDVQRAIGELLQADIVGGSLGRPAGQPDDNYFPGRPADVPEPGVGERPAGRPAMDLGGGFLGRAAVDNARGQLQALVSMAIDQLAQAQDTLAKMTALVDSVTALSVAATESLVTADHLVTAAVGADTGNLPTPAIQLRHQVAQAMRTMTVANDGVTMAMRVKIEQAFSQVASAIEAANEYKALP